MGARIFDESERGLSVRGASGAHSTVAWPPTRSGPSSCGEPTNGESGGHAVTYRSKNANRRAHASSASSGE
jgi:hypothetical protein